MKHKLRFNRHFHLNRKRYRPLCDGRRLAAARNEVWGEGGVRQEKCGCADVRTCGGAEVECKCVQVFKCSSAQVFRLEQNTI